MPTGASCTGGTRMSGREWETSDSACSSPDVEVMMRGSVGSRMQAMLWNMCWRLSASAAGD